MWLSVLILLLMLLAFVLHILLNMWFDKIASKTIYKAISTKSYTKGKFMCSVLDSMRSRNEIGFLEYIITVRVITNYIRSFGDYQTLYRCLIQKFNAPWLHAELLCLIIFTDWDNRPETEGEMYVFIYNQLSKINSKYC